MPKYGNSSPDLPICGFLRKLSKFQNRGVNTIQTSPQPPSNHVSNSNYAYFCVLGPRMPKYGNSAPDLQYLYFQKIVKVSESRYQYTSNQPSTTIQSCFKHKLCLLVCCFGPQILSLLVVQNEKAVFGGAPSRQIVVHEIINEIMSIRPSWTGSGFLVSYLTFLPSLKSIGQFLPIFDKTHE